MIEAVTTKRNGNGWAKINGRWRRVTGVRLELYEKSESVSAFNDHAYRVVFDRFEIEVTKRNGGSERDMWGGMTIRSNTRFKAAVRSK